MAFNATNPVTVGFATEKPQWDRLWDNVMFLKALVDRLHRFDFGGSLGAGIEDTANTWVDLPESKILEINGDDLPQMRLAMTCQQASAGTVTVETRLYNVTASAAVSSSDASKANPGTSKVLQKSSAFSLPTGTNQFKIQIRRTTTAAPVSALVEMFPA